jgi:hypothetical protein
VRTRIERLDVSTVNGSQLGEWIYSWKELRACGWDVFVLPLEVTHRGLRSVVALVGMAVRW